MKELMKITAITTIALTAIVVAIRANKEKTVNITIKKPENPINIDNFANDLSTRLRHQSSFHS